MDQSTLLGGLVLTIGIANPSLYNMVVLFIIFSPKYVPRNESDVMMDNAL
jgi:hypothetical protein